MLKRLKNKELMSKRLSKYISFFDHFDKFLFFLFATSSSISIASFETVIRAPLGITSASFSLTFSISTKIVKNVLKIMSNKKKKQNNIVMLARSKLNNIQNKTSEALINNEISHEDFMTIMNKERNYRALK